MSLANADSLLVAAVRTSGSLSLQAGSTWAVHSGPCRRPLVCSSDAARHAKGCKNVLAPEQLQIEG